MDTDVNSQNATGDVTVQRKFGDRGAIFVRGSVFGESRHNGTPLQTTSTTIRELDLGGNWDAHAVGFFELHAYASRQNLDQSFSAISSDRNSGPKRLILLTACFRCVNVRSTHAPSSN